MIENAELQETFGGLGREWIVPNHLFDKLESFPCQLYLSQTSANKVDDLCYGLFVAKKGNVEPHHLPPCSNALKKHIFCVNYQTAIWRRCLILKPEVPLPNGHGWKLETLRGQCTLTIDWMEIGTAPEPVMALLACNCAKSCIAQHQKCSCVVNGLNCSESCRLSSCENQLTEDVPQGGQLDGINNTDSDDDYEDLILLLLANHGSCNTIALNIQFIKLPISEQ